MQPQPASPSSALARLLAQAEAKAGPGFDELREADGRLRPVWSRFFSWFDGDAADLERLEAGVARQIRDDGVTHNVYFQGTRATRPWSLQLLPALIEASDWARIERGIAQRAGLLDAMLGDLYGEQRLLHEALLPPALVFRHRGYLHPLQGVVPPGNLRLHIAAFDLARGPDGQWSLLSQRTQAPSGLGYVLHNRLIVSRLFPEAFRELRVQHLASSYRRLLDTLFAQAAEVAGNATPRVVLLTPGPYSETYFEHAYLARYLGLPLVEGADLTVRDARLFLKTVEGLEPVHGVLRRLDDDWCDPLELLPESTLGVAGLLQVVRAGQVVIANALGAGFLESPALQGFLPAVCERLLGEPLALPSLPSWWCGERAAWEAVRPSLAGKVLRPSFPGGIAAEAMPDDATLLAAWRARVDADPDGATVQGRLLPSRTPLWAQGRLRREPATLRVYAIADAERRWHVLPGGMTRVAPGTLRISMQDGGSSLDTWVLSDGPVDLFSMLPQRLTVDDLAARRRPVSSRTAENLFWLGRYTERSEQLVRLARATLNLVDADADAPATVGEGLTRLAESTGLVPWGVPSLARAPQVFERALLAALLDPQATSIGFNLNALAHAADALRDRLSLEHWRLVAATGERFAASAKPERGHELPSSRRVLAALDTLAMHLAAVTGAQTDRMTRDHGWRLLATGRLVERLVDVARIWVALLDAGALASSEGVDLVLELFDSTITFRARYQRHDELLALADLLVLDETNPRSFAGVLRRLRTELRKLPGEPQAIEALLALLPPAGVGLGTEELRGLDDEAALAARLMRLGEELGAVAARLSDEIGRRYFALADAPERPMAV